jgi:hypothetical protein
LSVFHSRVADVALSQVQLLCQHPRQFGGVDSALFDPKK